MVAGDAAYLVNPFDVNEISEGMYKVLTDENLRKELIKKVLKGVIYFPGMRLPKNI